MKKGKKRITAWFLALCMVLSLVTGIPVKAAEGDEQSYVYTWAEDDNGTLSHSDEYYQGMPLSITESEHMVFIGKGEVREDGGWDNVSAIEANTAITIVSADGETEAGMDIQLYSEEAGYYIISYTEATQPGDYIIKINDEDSGISIRVSAQRVFVYEDESLENELNTKDGLELTEGASIFVKFVADEEETFSDANIYVDSEKILDENENEQWQPKEEQPIDVEIINGNEHVYKVTITGRCEDEFELHMQILYKVEGSEWVDEETVNTWIRKKYEGLVWTSDFDDDGNLKEDAAFHKNSTWNYRSLFSMYIVYRNDDEDTPLSIEDLQYDHDKISIVPWEEGRQGFDVELLAEGDVIISYTGEDGEKDSVTLTSEVSRVSFFTDENLTNQIYESDGWRFAADSSLYIKMELHKGETFDDFDYGAQGAAYPVDVSGETDWTPDESLSDDKKGIRVYEIPLEDIESYNIDVQCYYKDENGDPNNDYMHLWIEQKAKMYPFAMYTPDNFEYDDDGTIIKPREDTQAVTETSLTSVMDTDIQFLELEEDADEYTAVDFDSITITKDGVVLDNDSIKLIGAEADHEGALITYRVLNEVEKYYNIMFHEPGEYIITYGENEGNVITIYVRGSIAHIFADAGCTEEIDDIRNDGFGYTEDDRTLYLRIDKESGDDVITDIQWITVNANEWYDEEAHFVTKSVLAPDTYSPIDGDDDNVNLKLQEETDDGFIYRITIADGIEKSFWLDFNIDYTLQYSYTDDEGNTQIGEPEYYNDYIGFNVDRLFNMYTDGAEITGYSGSFMTRNEFINGNWTENHERLWVHADSLQGVIDKLVAFKNGESEIYSFDGEKSYKVDDGIFVSDYISIVTSHNGATVLPKDEYITASGGIKGISLGSCEDRCRTIADGTYHVLKKTSAGSFYVEDDVCAATVDFPDDLKAKYPGLAGYKKGDLVSRYDNGEGNAIYKVIVHTDKKAQTGFDYYTMGEKIMDINEEQEKELFEGDNPIFENPMIQLTLPRVHASLTADYILSGIFGDQEAGEAEPQFFASLSDSEEYADCKVYYINTTEDGIDNAGILCANSEYDDVFGTADKAVVKKLACVVVKDYEENSTVENQSYAKIYIPKVTAEVDEASTFVAEDGKPAVDIDTSEVAKDMNNFILTSDDEKENAESGDEAEAEQGLSQDIIDAVESGEELVLSVKADEVDTTGETADIPEEIQEGIDAIQEEIGESLSDEYDKQQFIDLSLNASIKDNDDIAPQKITKIREEMVVTVTLPELLRGLVKYYVVRYHAQAGKKADVIKATVTDGKLTFKTDRFSVYAIVARGANELDDASEELENVLNAAKWSDADKCVFDGTEQSSGITIEYAEGNDALPDGYSIGITGDKATYAGNYTAKVKILKEKDDGSVKEFPIAELELENEDIAKGKAWSIDKFDLSEYPLEWDGTRAYTYNGKEQTAEYKLKVSDELAKVVDVKYTGEKAAKVGEYEITATITPKFDESNYKGEIRFAEGQRDKATWVISDCPHSKTSITGKKDATTTAEGYTGDEVCDLCGETVKKGTTVPKLEDTTKKDEGGSGTSDDKTAADTVAAALNALPEAAAVTTTDESKIAEARKAYDALTADQKALVSADALKKLTDAEAALEAAKKAVSAAVGTEIASSNAADKSEYKVTSADAAAPTVEYAGTKDTSAKKITVPDTVTDANGVTYLVTKIADNALSGNKKITNVTIGANIIEIGKNAFKNCAKLKKITVKSSKLEVIGDGAFSGDKALTSIDLSKSRITTIGKNAFSGDKKLKTIKINANALKKVGKNAFKNIKKKATITIYAKDKKTYNKAVKLIKKSGAKNVKYKFKKKK